MALPPWSRPDVEQRDLAGRLFEGSMPESQILVRVVSPAGPTRGPVVWVEVSATGADTTTPNSPKTFTGLVPAELSPVRAGDLCLCFTQVTISDHFVLIPLTMVATTPAFHSTTTTTTDSPPCTGTCLWNWDDHSKKWFLSFSACLTDCACLAPDYCPANATACIELPCGRLQQDQVPVDCTTGVPPSVTTTNSACTTTTASNCATGCDFTCHPSHGWVKIRDGCAFPCYCNYPSNPCVPAINCTTASTACQQTTSSPVYCGGICRWVWDTGPNGWLLDASNCNSFGVPNCFCDAPTSSGTACGQELITSCYTHIYPGSTTPGCQPPRTPSATTPSPGSCNGNCVWINTAGAWALYSSCLSCTCDTPAGTPSSACSQTLTACKTTTTTPTPTTTTTTTTTTTPSTTTCGPYNCGSVSQAFPCKYICRTVENGGDGIWKPYTVDAIGIVVGGACSGLRYTSWSPGRSECNPSGAAEGCYCPQPDYPPSFGLDTECPDCTSFYFPGGCGICTRWCNSCPGGTSTTTTTTEAPSEWFFYDGAPCFPNTYCCQTVPCGGMGVESGGPYASLAACQAAHGAAIEC